MSDLRILVVDDSATMRRIVINTLKTIGYTSVVEAGDGKEALAHIYADEIQFIITDWNMPNMNGLELVKSVRADASYQNIPILLVTTRGVKEDIMEALQAKVNGYIVKPFTPQVLKEKLDQILKTNGS
jgi:two-component system, chemotaxis family, chemotaxis protein CheY